MTRAEILDAALNRPESLTTLELYALHQTLDSEVVETRRSMAVIDAEISKREAAGYVPGPDHLKQTMEPGSAE